MSRFKSIANAEKRIRQLEKQIREGVKFWNGLLEQAGIEQRKLKSERDLMARLAANPPQFSNPLDHHQAEIVRDWILEGLR